MISPWIGDRFTLENIYKNIFSTPTSKLFDQEKNVWSDSEVDIGRFSFQAYYYMVLQDVGKQWLLKQLLKMQVKLVLSYVYTCFNLEKKITDPLTFFC